MSQRYGRIHVNYWTSLDIIGLSLETKLVGAYILTCPHGNMIGCFRLPIAYVVDDLGMSCPTVSEGFRNLCDTGFITYDSPLSWVLISKFLKWNPIDNPNQGKAAAKQVHGVPRNSSVYAPLVQMLAANPSNFPEGFVNGLETVAEPYRTPQPQPQPQLQPHPHPEQKDLSSSIEKTVKAKASVRRFTPDEIETIYKAYPLHVKRTKAFEAIGKALKTIDDPDPVQYLLAIVREFADSPAGKKGEFTPHPSTWFNDKRWLDERAEWHKKGDDGSKREPRVETFAETNFSEAWGVPDGENVVRL